MSERAENGNFKHLYEFCERIRPAGLNKTATEALVKYLWVMFDKDIRVIVPQLAMSAGTMIACAAKGIVLGKQSSLGPIDPQIGGVPAQGVLDEFQMAVESIKRDPASTPDDRPRKRPDSQNPVGDMRSHWRTDTGGMAARRFGRGAMVCPRRQ